MQELFKTTNALVVIGEIPIAGARYVPKGDLLGRAEGPASTRQITAFNYKDLSTFQTIQQQCGISVSNISVQTITAYDYIKTYKENSIDVPKFLADKPVSKTVTMSGVYVMGVENTLPSHLDLQGGSLFMWDHIVNIFYFFYKNPVMYCMKIYDQTGTIASYNCGSCLFPKSLKIDITGGEQVSDAKWTMTFEGPYDETDIITNPVMDTGQYILRTLNTRDFSFATSLVGQAASEAN